MNPRTTRQYATLPGLPPRGPLPPIISVVIPLARTNIVLNPSVETNTTGYTAVGGTIGRSASAQYHGLYSLVITPSAGTNSDGAYYLTSTLVAGTTYAYSAKFKMQGASIGKAYALTIATTGGVDLVLTTFIATGRWQWIKGIYTEATGAARRIYFRKVNHADATAFFVDGVQLESCADGILDATTYIDGDQLGLLVGQQPPAYGWNGTPHASTSYRSALTRAGGYVVNLSAYNFLLTGLIGLGMAVPNNVSIPYTVLDGARFERTTKPQRTLSLPGRFQADDPIAFNQGLSAMRSAFDRDLVPLQQPLKLIVEPQDECGTVIGDFAQVQCLYAGGLDGNDSNYPIEDVAPTFTMYLPYLVGGSEGTGTIGAFNVANADYLVQRSPAGLWSAITGLNGTVNTIAFGPDGSLYAGGAFTNAGGVAAADFIAKWDGSAWTALGTGGNSTVNVIVFDAAGNLYAGGNFTLMGGVANTAGVAKWNGSAWSALSTGLTGGGAPACYALVFDRSGNLYAGGTFTDAGGSGADNFAKWNGAAWSVLGSATAINSGVTALAADPAGNIYLGGSFTNAGGVAAADNIAKWNGTAYVALSTGMNSSVSSLLLGANGILYAGGNFTTAGGVAATYVAQWNGTGWAPMGSGMNGAVSAMDFGLGGQALYASGVFTTADGITLPDRAAQWNGSGWIPLDIDLPGAPTLTAVATRLDGSLYFGYSTSGTAVASTINVVTNTGPGIVYPVITFSGLASGTARIYQVKNNTTNVGNWFNLTMLAGETITMNFDPSNPTFTGSFQGDVGGTLLPGSQPSLFALGPGNSTLSFFVSDATVLITIFWQKRYNGYADLVN
jgi:carbohydrate binding protein with CBM4/9 domain